MFEIGNSLREARVRQGLEISQVELATKIRSKYLRAIEDEQFALLPDEPYVKGFLHAYAEYLGLDGSLYVDEYSSRFVTDRFDDMPQRRGSTTRPRRQVPLERRVVLLGLAGILALAALVIVAWKFGGSGASTPGVLSPQSQLPTELQLTGLGSGTYVEVRRNSANGPVLLQATVPGGKVERVTGSRFWVYVKQPAGIQVLLGGKAVALPARKNLRVIVTPSRTSVASG
ncbi:MAG TPA: helix-turn-helix transcriptional regulator [Gaiellaceae bacterium]|nr:helix-turn-helix transcriptional regulator [Gaiellaceae bacterium]